MKFTYAELGAARTALTRLEDRTAGVRSELHPFYPDNNMTSGDLDALQERVDNAVHAAHLLRAHIVDLKRLAESPVPEVYDTTRELRDDQGTYDPSPRD